MTRDEAVKIAGRYKLAGECQLVDCLAALGILQIEQPVDIVQEFKSNIRSRMQPVQFQIVEDTLKQFGLKIVKA